MKINLSLVIPFYNESNSLKEIYESIKFSISKYNNILKYEIIFVDDGSIDNSWLIIRQISKLDKRVKGLKFNTNFGKSTALDMGFKYCKGDVIITMDADLQDNSREIPFLYEIIKYNNYNLVSGWKKNRKDSFIKIFSSKFFNFFSKTASNIKLNDFNCGLKAYSFDLVKRINIHDGIHRFIPIISKYKGFSKIYEKKVFHFSRVYGKTKFNNNRFFHGILDLIFIIFNDKFKKKSIYFLGILWIIFFSIVFFLFFFIIIYNFFLIKYNIYTKLITEFFFFIFISFYMFFFLLNFKWAFFLLF